MTFATPDQRLSERLVEASFGIRQRVN